jgi:thermitase
MIKRIVICLLLVALSLSTRAAGTNTLVWHRTTDRVDADIRGMELWPLLEQIAMSAGWRIFVEPDTTRTTSAKFKDLPSGDALKRLLGNLNFALVPRTNGVPQLYVFRTAMKNATQRVRAPKAAPEHAPNELLVKLKPGTNADALAKSIGAKIIGRDDKLGIYRLLFASADATDAALAALKNNSDVQAVDYNYYFDPPILPQLLDNAPVGPVSLSLDPDTTGDPCNPIIGLIDTPVQSLGSQLDAFLMKAVSVVNEAGSGGSTLPTHGTAMAETILRAVAKAADGKSNVKILPVDVYGTEEMATSWNVALGVKMAVDNGATVINLSLAGTSDSAVLSDIIKQALAQGVVIYAAAGNEPVTSPTYPAATPGVIAVTATQGSQLAPYANYGSFVSLALPGASVIYLGSQAYIVQGTSPATAYASGVAAGTKGINCAPWAQIQSAMQQKFTVPTK